MNDAVEFCGSGLMRKTDDKRKMLGRGRVQECLGVPRPSVGAKYSLRGDEAVLVKPVPGAWAECGPNQGSRQGGSS
jgi:hypothetical protein